MGDIVDCLPGAVGEGKKRTDLDCHDCSKMFVAELDFSINGNHIIECPHCGHQHCRVIEDGAITGERWSDRNHLKRVDVEKRCVWKSSVLVAQTSTTSAFIRDLWLNPR